MGILRDDKTPEQKREEAVKRQEVRQSSLNVDKLEAQLAASRQKEQENTRNQLLDVTQDKEKLKKLLLNVDEQYVPDFQYYCQNCGEKVEKSPCSDCGEEENFVKRQDGYTVQTVEVLDDSLMNRRGFHKVVWSQIESNLGSGVAGGYLSKKEVNRLNYVTLGEITNQLALRPWLYGISNPSDMGQISDITRTPIVSHTSKARGGRGLESTEKTLVEKVSQAITGEEEEEDENRIL